MRFALISMGDSGTLELNNILKDKLDLALPWENHLYPDELLKKYGLDTKVIFITRNIKDLIKLVEDKKDDNNWIGHHYKNMSSDKNDFKNLIVQDTLNFEKLFDAYLNQKHFDILFIKYEKLFFDNRNAKDILSYFLDKNIENINLPSFSEIKTNYNFTWDTSLQNKIDSFLNFKIIENKQTRKFFVCSWGGVGSKVICKYLDNFGKTYHFHDRYTYENLSYPIIGKKNYSFNDCCYFSNNLIEKNNIKNYTVIFIYRNPIYSIYSRFVENIHGQVPEHLDNIRCYNTNIKLINIIEEKKDLYDLNEFFDNYTLTKNNYDIYCIKYELLFKNIDIFNDYFNLNNDYKIIEKLTKKEMKYFDYLNVIYSDLISKQNRLNFIYCNKSVEKQIDAIFIQSFHKEIIVNTLQPFLDTLYTKLNNIYFPVVLFLDEKSKKYSDKLNLTNFQNLKVIFVNDNEYKNLEPKVSFVFYTLINYEIERYPNILLLESDCYLKDNFIEIINNDLSKYNFMIYGSYYYGLAPVFKKHINGVAVYNRKNKVLLKKIYDLFITKDNLNKDTGYDYLISTNCNRNMLVDSKYIINICSTFDTNLNYKDLKKDAVIVHQKDNTTLKYNRLTFKNFKDLK